MFENDRGRGGLPPASAIIPGRVPQAMRNRPEHVASRTTARRVSEHPRVLERNRLDMELYEFGCKLLDSRLKELGQAASVATAPSLTAAAPSLTEAA
jgi:hypothetical protein